MSPALRRALAGATAAATGVWIGQAMQLPDTHWVVVTVLTLLRPGAESTAARTVQRLAATAAGALFVIFLYGVGDPQPGRIMTIAVLVVGACAALMHFTPARYALVLFAVTAGGFAIEGLDHPLGVPSLMGARVFHIALASLLLFVAVTTTRYRDSGTPAGDSTTPAQAADHGLRVMLACCLGLGAAAAIERPDYGGAIVITICVLGARTDFTSSLQVGVQRLAGALFGGALALAFLTLLLDSATGIASLMIVVFVVCWVCLLLIGIPSLTYLVFQTGFVFAWSLADTLAPDARVWVPLERMAQVAIGAAALLLVYAVPLGTPARRAARA